jgi:hypothetical protein
MDKSVTSGETLPDPDDPYQVKHLIDMQEALGIIIVEGEKRNWAGAKAQLPLLRECLNKITSVSEVRVIDCEVRTAANTFATYNEPRDGKSMQPITRALQDAYKFLVERERKLILGGLACPSNRPQ